MNKTLSGSVLASVLVVCVLMLMALFACLSLWDIDVVLFAGYHKKKQMQEYVESGFTLWCYDSTLINRLDNKGKYRLFPEEENSEIYFSHRMWGLYEVVEVTEKEGKVSAIRMIGKTVASKYNGSFWFCDNQKSLALAGNSRIEGKVFLPSAGVIYSQLKSEFFSGTPLIPSEMKKSEKEWPVLTTVSEQELNKLHSLSDLQLSEEITSCSHSFRDSVKLIRLEGNLYDIELAGNIIIYADRLYLDKSCRLNDIIVVASHITVGDGFSGTLQLFATDTVILGRQVRLAYPSGICMRGPLAEKLLSVGDYAEIEGYTCVENGADVQERPPLNYIQPITAKVRGVVAVNGVAQLQGQVEGAVYLRDSYYFSPEGYYADIIYNLTVSPEENTAYPFWMDGPYERRVVKCLY